MRKVLAKRMRVGIIVEGDAEYRSLGRLFTRMTDGGQVVSVLLGDIQPNSPFPRMAKAVQSRLSSLAADNVDLAIVLFDREQRNECPSTLAQCLCDAISTVCAPVPVPRVAVVIKDRCFENWLVSDIDTVARMRRRFTVSEGVQRKIKRGRADAVDAMALLKESVVGKQYDKIVDAKAILDKADPLEIAHGSRSFRRLMRLIGHPAYTDQSKVPAKRKS